jgi:exodeoxyribonuclease V alpha subunit
VRYESSFGVGDKVIQTKNNYDFEIFNGDIGYIQQISKEAGRVYIRFDQAVIEMPLESLDEVRLAYAMTIHKSQGSEAPVVILPMTTQHYMMLQRNLLYTGVTRGKRLVIVVGQPDAIWAAIQNNRASQRVSRLAQLLRGKPA